MMEYVRDNGEKVYENVTYKLEVSEILVDLEKKTLFHLLYAFAVEFLLTHVNMPVDVRSQQNNELGNVTAQKRKPSRRASS